MPDSLQSLGVLGEETRREREALLRHTDSVDTKAGVILGAAGALAALGGVSPWRLPALVASVLAGLATLPVLWPRRYRARGLREMRTHYLRSEPRFTELMLLDNGIHLVELMRATLEHKARWLQRAAALLALAAALHAAGTLAQAIGG